MKPIVYIVDDDKAIRESLLELLEVTGFSVRAFTDGASFLAAYAVDDGAGCVLLDVAMPGMSGHEVQASLQARGAQIPILFLTGHGNIPMAVDALHQGALDFLEKPVRSEILLERVSRALVLDMERRTALADEQQLKQRYARLTQRERQVMRLVVSGMQNKEIARKLALSPRTVETHRKHVMHKMGAVRLAELISIAADCDD
jgi:two-component system response regulator FixJ